MNKVIDEFWGINIIGVTQSQNEMKTKQMNHKMKWQQNKWIIERAR